MLRLRIVQAEFGDCLILEYGTSSDRKYILIDGGPASNYDNHLRNELRRIKTSGGSLELAVSSHVDNDHIIGLLDFVTELRQQKADGKPGTISLKGFWHNTFSSTIDTSNKIQTGFRNLMANAGSASKNMLVASISLNGIGEANKVRLACKAMNIPVNPGFPHDLITVEEATKPITFDNLTLRIVGPTKENLEELRLEWEEWIKKHEEIIGEDPAVAAAADRSVPNLSSIMFVAEADGKKILFTGDGRGDHLVQGLTKSGLLKKGGTFHVDYLKMPHHGSDRNVSREFFKIVTADKYIISANGRYDNPDLDALEWILESANERGITVEIIVTNDTVATRQLVKKYDPSKHAYRLTIMDKGADSMILEVAG